MIISVDAESLQQNSISLHDKSPEGTRYRKILSQYNKKGYIQKTCSQHHTEWGEHGSISSEIRNETRMFTLTLLFNVTLDILARAIKQENKINGI